MKRAPGHARKVARSPQPFEIRLDIRRQRSAEPRHLNGNRRTPRHQRRARGHTLRRSDIRSLKPHAVGGKAIQMWRSDIRVPVSTDMRGAVIVGQNKENVWTLLCGYGVRRPEETNGDNSYEPGSASHLSPIT
jgi:hypothetical protein